MLLFVYTTIPKRFVFFTCRYFKLSWSTTALSQSNCRNFSCSSINKQISNELESIWRWQCGYSFLKQTTGRTVCFTESVASSEKVIDKRQAHEWQRCNKKLLPKQTCFSDRWASVPPDLSFSSSGFQRLPWVPAVGRRLPLPAGAERPPPSSPAPVVCQTQIKAYDNDANKDEEKESEKNTSEPSK